MPDYVPLAFGFEALYPPMGLNAAQLRALYIRLAEPCRFTEYKQLGEGQGARFAEGANRHLTITHDRLVYRDDYTQALFSSYGEDTRRILRELREVFQIPVLLHCKVLVRLLMPYAGPDTTFEYFQQHLLSSASSKLSFFDRAASGVGLRLVFPPMNENRSTFHLRIEPYFRDKKMFFLENNSQFFDPLVNFDDVQRYLDETYDFLKEKGGPFVLDLGNTAQE
ncbi:hypothetical protein K8I31_07720 [bacterium]|nr:hypothetical protein [bacterium]